MHDVTVTMQTHRGARRSANEDAITAGSVVAASDMSRPAHMTLGVSQPMVFAVSDGLGGQSAGEIASEHVARRLAEVGPQLTSAALPKLMATLDEELREHAGQYAEFDGMGTTVAGILLTPQTREVAWCDVGDSRIYRLDQGLTQISVDDSLPGGGPTNYITQSLGGGSGRTIEPHVGTDQGTGWLLTSDGLTDLVSDEHIAHILAAAPDDTEAVYRLWATAMEAGGTDNISVMIVRVH